jgi:hypothetical protein
MKPGKQNRGPKPPPDAKPGEPQPQPLKRHPKLFAALTVAFAVWLGVLLTLYMKTVYPMRHSPSTASSKQ